MRPERVRAIRDSAGLSIRELARELNIAPRSLRRWEAGTHPVPDDVIADLEWIERDQR